jgi:hypothetical protein
VKIEIAPALSNGSGTAAVEQVQISYQIFEGMAQPQPGPGPLAEVVRTVLELDPDRLKQELRRLEGRLHAQSGLNQEDAGPADAGGTGPDEASASHHD